MRVAANVFGSELYTDDIAIYESCISIKRSCKPVFLLKVRSFLIPQI